MNKNKSSYHVHKFGGTSLASSEHFRKIAQLTQQQQPVAIVVSATAGSTNQLQQLLDLAQAQQPFVAQLTQLQQRHLGLIDELIRQAAVRESLCQRIDSDRQAIDKLLQTASLLGRYDVTISDKVLAYGELWSAAILQAYLQQQTPTVFIDAAQVLVTYEKHQQRCIDWQQSQQLLGEQTQQLVITGFIARGSDGQVVTLGRNGSDYSAAIFARLLAAKELILWTDVDGVYSADPRKVQSAFALPVLSYEEALELAYFGAKVIHPQTIFPAVENNIPILIKNSLHPEAAGTLISAAKHAGEFLVQGLSCVDDIALINIEGSGMTGVSGIAARAFQRLHYHDISVIFISQASSEHSICLAVNQGLADKAIQSLTDAFQFELEQHLVKGIVAQNDCVILAAVGDGMVGKTGVAGRLCSTLARANVNIRAIAQGSSERNISVVIARGDANKALRAVHAGFYLSRKTLSIGLIGPGQVGATLLQQIADEFASLQETHQVNLRVHAIMNSRQMLLASEAIDLANWQTALQGSEQMADVDSFIEHLLADDAPHAVMIDCTANAYVADQYQKFLAQGIHVITPNKRANSGDFAYYQSLQAEARDKQCQYLYETTVCAGLPVIKTLQDIIATGDTVLRIEGVVSGTLSYIFNRLANGDVFSTIVREAHSEGYTEPDPRDDLSGMDVARKFVCLAREMGFAAMLDEVSLTNLVPAALADVSIDEFLQRLPEFDQQMTEQLAAMFAAGKTPCYMGEITEQGVISVAMQGIDNTHPFSRLQGTDNMLIFTTQRYQQQPLIIQGPGAGKAVTAAGVFSDLLRLVASLGDNAC